jgi:hypothetical protein
MAFHMKHQTLCGRGQGYRQAARFGDFRQIQILVHTVDQEPSVVSMVGHGLKEDVCAQHCLLRRKHDAVAAGNEDHARRGIRAAYECGDSAWQAAANPSRPERLQQFQSSDPLRLLRGKGRRHDFRREQHEMQHA